MTLVVFRFKKAVLWGSLPSVSSGLSSGSRGSGSACIGLTFCAFSADVGQPLSASHLAAPRAQFDVPLAPFRALPSPGVPFLSHADRTA